MPGKNPRLNPLHARKQLLVAASELNRAQLVQECATMAEQTHALACQAMSLKSFVSVAASLFAGLAPFRRKKPATAAKPSWLQTVLNGAQLVSTLWQTFRPQNRG
jgi:hypothetical protein